MCVKLDLFAANPHQKKCCLLSHICNSGSARNMQSWIELQGEGNFTTFWSLPFKYPWHQNQETCNLFPYSSPIYCLKFTTVKIPSSLLNGNISSRSWFHKTTNNTTEHNQQEINHHLWLQLAYSCSRENKKVAEWGGGSRLEIHQSHQFVNHPRMTGLIA